MYNLERDRRFAQFVIFLLLWVSTPSFFFNGVWSLGPQAVFAQKYPDNIARALIEKTVKSTISATGAKPTSEVLTDTPRIESATLDRGVVARLLGSDIDLKYAQGVFEESLADIELEPIPGPEIAVATKIPVEPVVIEAVVIEALLETTVTSNTVPEEPVLERDSLVNRTTANEDYTQGGVALKASRTFFLGVIDSTPPPELFGVTKCTTT